MTYTVMVANPEKKEIGIALTTVTINCARIAPFHHNLVPNWTENGLVAAPQATVNPHNAHRLFELRGQGKNFAEIEQILAAEDEHWSWRQVGAITAEGEIFAYTGKDAWDHASHIAGTNSLAIGNFLDGQHVTVAMAEALEKNVGIPLAERLISGIEAGREAGGQSSPETGPVPELFAMIQVFNSEQPWPAVDLRVDFDLHAVAKLRRLLTQTSKLDPILQVMCKNPAKTFDEYHTVLDIMNAQI